MPYWFISVYVQRPLRLYPLHAYFKPHSRLRRRNSTSGSMATSLRNTNVLVTRPEGEAEGAKVLAPSRLGWNQSQLKPAGKSKPIVP